MKKLKGVLILSAALVFLGGCVVGSIYPYYRTQDLVYDPSLVGKWVHPGSTNEDDDGPEFKQFGTNSYMMPVDSDKSSTNYAWIHLFEIDGRRFLDGRLTNDVMYHTPEHYVWRIKKSQSTLEAALLNMEWLESLLKTNPQALRHTIVEDNPNDGSSKRIVLTADTAELQKFILKYADDTNAFNLEKFEKKAD